jgi:hypothetical protein
MRSSEVVREVQPTQQATVVENIRWRDGYAPCGAAAQKSHFYRREQMPILSC